MKYLSTRDASLRLDGAEVISRGLSHDGGLFVPEEIPTLTKSVLNEMCTMDYRARAAKIMGMYLTDYSADELAAMTAAAYGENYDCTEAAPVYELKDGTWFLELWHGPTCAFKDMALQILPRFLTAALKKTGETKQVCILAATSGDTGKAALEGFADVPGTKILVFYPRDGVSDVQKLQMQTQSGANVEVCSVNGNFDDAQTGVKLIFGDESIRAELEKNGWFLSSANSINWGRLLPQIVYYVSAYCDLVNAGSITMGDEINFCVPTGNFGDILAGYYAKLMGLPVKKLICASNRNDVLTEFLKTGVYDRNRPFYTTISPSMDILVSSNLERLLFHASGEDDSKVAGYMKLLGTSGKYEVDDCIISKLQETFEAGSCDDESTKQVIGRIWNEFRYLMDTHTAVAYDVLEKYRKDSGDNAVSVVVSTASPYKFCAAVLEAIGESAEGSGLDLIDRLEAATNTEAPKPLKTLRSKTVRFTGNTDKEDMPCVVTGFLQ